MLKLPPTLRRPTLSELSHIPGMEEKMNSAQDALIVPGFVIRPNTTRDKDYNFFAAVNIDNPVLWDLFVALSGLMPGEVGCIYGMYEDDLEYSKYMPRVSAMDIFLKFKQEIVSDCNMRIGLVNNDDDSMVEVFISEVKYISFWGNDEASFRKVMQEFNLEEIPGLQFMDEFPSIVTPLTKMDKHARNTRNIIESIGKLITVAGN